MVWSKVLRPTRHKIGHFGDVLLLCLEFTDIILTFAVLKQWLSQKNRNWNPFCLYNYYLFTVNCRYTASLVSQIQKFKKLNLSGLTSIETQTVSPRKACSTSKFSQFYREKRYKTRISVSLNILCQICSNRHNS